MTCKLNKDFFNKCISDAVFKLSYDGYLLYSLIKKYPIVWNLGGRVPNGLLGYNLFGKLDVTVVTMLFNVCVFITNTFK